MTNDETEKTDPPDEEQLQLFMNKGKPKGLGKGKGKGKKGGKGKFGNRNHLTRPTLSFDGPKERENFPLKTITKAKENFFLKATELKEIRLH